MQMGVVVVAAAAAAVVVVVVVVIVAAAAVGVVGGVGFVARAMEIQVEKTDETLSQHCSEVRSCQSSRLLLQT